MRNSSQSELTGLINFLFRDGLIERETALTAFKAVRRQKMSVTSYLVKAKILSGEQILQACAKHFGLPVFDLKNYDTDWLNHAAMTPELINRYRVLPLHREEDSLRLGITDPTDYATIAALSFQTGLRIHPMLVAEEGLDHIIHHHCRNKILNSQLESALAKMNLQEEEAPLKTHPEQSDEPVIDFVDQLIRDAIEKNISDIHIEPYETTCRIRFRRDGLLYEALTLPTHFATRVITRLKIMANLNIAERRLPQDGRIHSQNNDKIDIRINTCPILHNEKIVLRLLNTQALRFDMDTLGFNEAQKNVFLNELSKPQGLILVTGPTGSGKTVTLYSALAYLNKIEINLSTVEDPVEIELAGINQVNINPKIGLDFASVLRTFLRQDPDIIMVGEIRDIETANIAIQAAQTGHLVLSTLHTNNAIETVTRLHAMGIDTYHIIHSVTLIIAQRLIRKLCEHCKMPTETAYRAVGCDQCHHGYQGRIAIFELLPITEKNIHAILSGANAKETIAQTTCSLLWEAGLEKMHAGLTSYAELLRVLGK